MTLNADLWIPVDHSVVGSSPTRGLPFAWDRSAEIRSIRGRSRQVGRRWWGGGGKAAEKSDGAEADLFGSGGGRCGGGCARRGQEVEAAIVNAVAVHALRWRLMRGSGGHSQRHIHWPIRKADGPPRAGVQRATSRRLIAPDQRVLETVGSALHRWPVAVAWSESG
ncbi:hypothetical protein CC85DRAFT_32933 [Cutaneotrichosporon oleaginosum]|uniref:Uncharacterized protein n=1 Tax=Cutaneotrichosporon oleaginosum TaxID=879819 RepID=A0A0J0XSV6_9TREE|nr:uncharacterized protein CC85DRAFT_32933 [Cutaneotrichosporon oleaginosum]KLT44158.1 hypothetical protein CC85DRAFT_32933 [Cutaneotrichosporon oleaginosum]TXT09387.1 hypothetical protein COLE_03321 [Cutaneotrichosporon oleaginosum]